MPAANELVAEQDLALCEALLRRVCEDLGMLLDRSLAIESLEAERSASKVAGERTVHIAFKFALSVQGVAQRGAILVPLSEAITMAAYLMMQPDDSVAALRKQMELERAQKDALVEVGSLMVNSIDGALRDLLQQSLSARSEGCQGLRAGAAPAFERAPGVELVIGRAKARLHTFPSFELLLMLPALAPAAPPAAA